jgi:hypothetical protein
MQIIPLNATPSQSMSVNLAGQDCRFSVYQRSTGVYLDLFVSNNPIIQGVLCRDRSLLVRDTYLGLAGDLAFTDTQGLNDPEYSGLGGRFLLVYLEAGEV